MFLFFYSLADKRTKAGAIESHFSTFPISLMHSTGRYTISGIGFFFHSLMDNSTPVEPRPIMDAPGPGLAAIRVWDQDVGVAYESRFCELKDDAVSIDWNAPWQYEGLFGEVVWAAGIRVYPGVIMRFCDGCDPRDGILE